MSEEKCNSCGSTEDVEDMAGDDDYSPVCYSCRERNERKAEEYKKELARKNREKNGRKIRKGDFVIENNNEYNRGYGIVVDVFPNLWVDPDANSHLIVFENGGWGEIPEEDFLLVSDVPTNKIKKIKKNIPDSFIEERPKEYNLIIKLLE